MKGSPGIDEVVFLHRPSKTLILPDLCFHFEPSNWQTRLLLGGIMGVKGYSQSRALRMMVKDRAAAKASAEEILSWDFDKVVMSHGEPVVEQAKARTREAWWWLLA